MSSLSAELESLPRAPLTMSMLVALPSARLRRLLKAGLRRGLSEAELAALLHQDWSCDPGSPAAVALLAALVERGWLSQQLPEQIWKTHLGNPLDR